MIKVDPSKLHRRLAHIASAALILLFGMTSVATAETTLPERTGPPVKVTSGVPHVQMGVTAVPDVNAELMRRVELFPSLDIRPTVISLPGATGFWLLEDLKLKRPEVIAGGREFAHIHPDGSLHASLPPQRAFEAVAKGWAARHPWADKRDGWEGFVMLFTPRTMEELEVTFQLILDGYNFVTGNHLRAEDLVGG